MGAPLEVTLVTAESCHFCEDAQALLQDISNTYDIDVRLVDMMSDEGRHLVVAHRMPFPPLLLIDGTMFGYGRISARKLDKYLASHASTLEVR